MEAASEPSEPGPALGANAHYDELLARLRDQKAPSLDGYPGLEDRIETIRLCISEKLSWLCGEPLQLTHVGVEMFSGKPDERFSGKAKLSARSNFDEDEFFSCMFLPVAGYRYLLTAALVGIEEPISEPSENELTGAENCLFLRLVDTVTSGFFEALESGEDLTIPRRPELVDEEEAAALVSAGEIVSITFEIAMLDQQIPLQILTPAYILAPIDDDEENDDASAPSSSALMWKREMMLTLENVRIDLGGQLACQDLPLSEVEAYEVGQTLDLDIQMNGLKIVDEHGQTLFLADLELAESGTYLRVTSSAKVGGA